MYVCMHLYVYHDFIVFGCSHYELVFQPSAHMLSLCVYVFFCQTRASLAAVVCPLGFPQEQIKCISSFVHEHCSLVSCYRAYPPKADVGAADYFECLDAETGGGVGTQPH